MHRARAAGSERTTCGRTCTGLRVGHGQREAGAREGKPDGGTPATEGPEEIGAATQRRLLGALPRPADVARRRSWRTAFGTVARRARDALLDDLDPISARRSPSPARCRSRSSRPRVRARRACSPGASRSGSARSTRRSRATCSRSRSRARPPASSSTGSAASASTAASPPARSTRSRSPSCGGRAIERGREPPRVLDRKAPPARRRSIGERGARRARRRHRRRGRDRVGQGPARRARRVRRPRRASPGAGCRAPRRRDRRRSTQRYETEKRTAPPPRLRRRARASARTRSTRDPEFARRAALALPAPVRRRVPGRDAAAARACSARGSATAPTCAVVGDPAQAIYGVRGRRRVAAARLRPRVPGRHDDRARAQLPQLACRRRARRGRARAGGRPRRACAPRQCAATAPRPRSPRTTTTTPRPTAVADACRRAFTRGVPWHDIAVLFRTNAQCARFEAALAGRLVPFRVTESGRFATRPGGRALLDRLRKAEHEAPERPLARSRRRSRGRRHAGGRRSPCRPRDAARA